jgi:hypothetical protein
MLQAHARNGSHVLERRKRRNGHRVWPDCSGYLCRHHCGRERLGHEAQDNVQFGFQPVEVVARGWFAAAINRATMFRTVVVALAAMAAFDLLVLNGAYLHALSAMLFY